MSIINVKNKKYSKKEFLKIINGISNGTNAYERYLIVKNNLEEKNKLKTDEAEKLYEYLKQDLERVDKMIAS